MTTGQWIHKKTLKSVRGFYWIYVRNLSVTHMVMYSLRKTYSSVYFMYSSWSIIVVTILWAWLRIAKQVIHVGKCKLTITTVRKTKNGECQQKNTDLATQVQFMPLKLIKRRTNQRINFQKRQFTRIDVRNSTKNITIGMKKKKNVSCYLNQIISSTETNSVSRSRAKNLSKLQFFQTLKIIKKFIR